MKGTNGPMVPSVFISHAGTDENWAGWLRWALLSMGFRVELATVDWPNSSTLTQNIERAFRQNDCMACLLSRSYFEEGRWSQDELASAWDYQKSHPDFKIIFLIIDDIKPPPPYNGRIFHDLFGIGETRALQIVRNELTKIYPKVRPTKPESQTDKPIFPAFDISVWLPRSATVLSGGDRELIDNARVFGEQLLNRLRHVNSTMQMEILSNSVFDLARAHGFKPPREVLREALLLSEKLADMKDSESNPKFFARATEAQAFLAGVISYAALDMGESSLSSLHARAMVQIGEALDIPEIKAWASGTLSLIFRFEGKNEDALRAAVSGLELDLSQWSRARLHAQAALCCANMGRGEDALTHLRLCEEGLTTETGDTILKDGIFYFGRAKFHYYAGIANLALGNYADSASQSQRAIEFFADGDANSKSISDSFLAYVHLAHADLMLGHEQKVADDLAPIFTLPTKYRTSWHREKLKRLSRLFSPESEKIAKKIDEFIDTRAA